MPSFNILTVNNFGCGRFNSGVITPHAVASSNFYFDLFSTPMLSIESQTVLVRKIAAAPLFWSRFAGNAKADFLGVKDSTGDCRRERRIPARSSEPSSRQADECRLPPTRESGREESRPEADAEFDQCTE